MTGVPEKASCNNFHDTHTENRPQDHPVLSDNCAAGRAVLLGSTKEQLFLQILSLPLSLASRASLPSRQLRREIASPC